LEDIQGGVPINPALINGFAPWFIGALQNSLITSTVQGSPPVFGGTKNRYLEDFAVSEQLELG